MVTPEARNKLYLEAMSENLRTWQVALITMALCDDQLQESEVIERVHFIEERTQQ